MSTLDELIYYCGIETPTGAFMLNGEWGIGKTHLIEKELTKALAHSHVIVRVSLYGMSSVKELHSAVKEKWVYACSPLLGRIAKDQEQVSQNRGLINALNAILKGLNPTAGRAADLMVSMNLLEMLTVETEIEDIREKKTKRVILVFDDLERSKINPIEMMGAINEYCENRNFSTIIVTNEDYMIHTMKDDLLMYHMLKGKTVARSIYYVPDFEKILHSLISERKWNSTSYKDYLIQQEKGILKLFASDSQVPDHTEEGPEKTHNLLALTHSLQDFYRIYSHLLKVGIENPDNWFYPFVAFYMSRKSGIFRKRIPQFDCSDEIIHQVYPMFSPDYLYDSIRNWISYGIWEKDRFANELTESLYRLCEEGSLPVARSRSDSE